MAEFPEGFILDLADAFAGYLEDVPDFLEGAVVAVVDAEAEANDAFLASGEGFEHLIDLFFKEGAFGKAFGTDDGAVFDEIAEDGIFGVVSDGFVEGDGFLGDGEDGFDLFDGHIEDFGDFFREGIPAEFLLEAAAGAVDLVDGFDHVDSDADGSGLVSNGPGDGLANPPGGVGGEFIALAVVILFHGAHETGVSFLDEVEEFEATVVIAFGDGDDEADVGLDHFVLGFFFVAFCAVDFAEEEDEVVSGHLGFELNAADLAAGVLDFAEGFDEYFWVDLGFGADFLIILVGFFCAAAVGADFVDGIAFDAGEIGDAVIAFLDAFHEGADAVHHALDEFFVVGEEVEVVDDLVS